ncbi:hypothetical protein [Caballeronia temeraria]
MDKVTQQDAAIVEQASAAAHVGGEDIGSFDGYESPEALEEAARETGTYPDRGSVLGRPSRARGGIMEQEKDQPVILRIYRLPSGLWGGRLSAGEDDIGELGAFPSTKEVEQAAADTGLYPDRVEIEED